MLKPMRGQKPKKDKDILFPCYASPKIDGIRAVVKDGVVLSKTLKPIPNQIVQQMFSHLHGADGELVVGKPFGSDVYERSRGPIMRHHGLAEFKFCLFDRWDMPEAPAHERLQKLTELEGLIESGDIIHYVSHTLVRGLDELQQLEAQVLEQGYEGLMLRHIDGRYKYGTSTPKQQWLVKIKRFEEGEAEILSVEEQMENTNQAKVNELGLSSRSSAKDGKVPKGTLGAFVAKDLVSGAVFNVGTGEGLTESLRASLWEQRDSLPGRIIRYRYQKVGTQVAPRLPIWTGFRDEIDLSEVSK